MKFWTHFLLMTFSTQVLYAQNISKIVFTAADGKTEFLALGRPAMIKIAGEGSGPNGTATISADTVNADLSVNLSSLTTKIDLRDEHMKNKYLEISKFSDAVLSIKDLKLPKKFSEISNDEIEMPFKGDFNLHGVTEPVTGLATLRRSEKYILGTASFKVQIMKHLDSLPSYLGIKVAEVVDVKVQFKGLVQ